MLIDSFLRPRHEAVTLERLAGEPHCLAIFEGFADPHQLGSDAKLGRCIDHSYLRDSLVHLDCSLR